VVAPQPGTEGVRRFGSAEPIARSPGALRLATYNAENLFDDHDDPALSGAHEDAGQAKPPAQLRALAATIHRLDADVLAMQEVESYDALIEFRDAYLSDMGYKYVVSIDAGDERGIEQSVLSRFPLTDPTNWVHLALGGVQPERVAGRANQDAGKPMEFHRSPLRVTVEVPEPGSPGKVGYRLTLFVVHHKSGKGYEYWREKEAAKAAELIEELEQAEPERNIAVLGDFNSTHGEAPVRQYAKAGLIDVFDDNAERASGSIQDTVDHNAAARGNKKTRVRHDAVDPAWITHESGRAIDLILLNGAAKRELVPGSKFVLGTPARAAGTDYRVTDPPAGYASDHYPVALELVPRDR
jgi:endonuclease/exonuclease/phosphatase family metal-dependent hydrolase